MAILVAVVLFSTVLIAVHLGSSPSVKKVSGIHTELTHLSPQKVDQLIDALDNHDNFALIDASMHAHGLQNQHFRAVGFTVIEKATGMSDEVIISPYDAIDPSKQIFGSVGIGESDVRGVVVRINGDKITYTLLYVEDGKVVEQNLDLNDIPDTTSAPATFEDESNALIAKEAIKLFTSDDYTLSTYTPEDIEQMKSFTDLVSGIAVHLGSSK